MSTSWVEQHFALFVLIAGVAAAPAMSPWSTGAQMSLERDAKRVDRNADALQTARLRGNFPGGTIFRSLETQRKGPRKGLISLIRWGG